MIPDSKYRQIAQGLLAKTQANQVDWKPVAGSAQSYVVTLPQSMIYLEYHSPPTEPDFVRLRLSRRDGMTVGEWDVENGSDDWELASTLFGEVHGRHTGWDNVLRDVEAFIGK